MSNKNGAEFMSLQAELKKIEACEKQLGDTLAKEKITSLSELQSLVSNADGLNYTADKLVEARALVQKLTVVETDLNDKFIASKDSKGEPVVERDLDDLNKLLKQAEELKFNSPLVEKAKKQRKKFTELDAELKEAVDAKDVKKVEQTLQTAEEEKLKSKGVEKAKKFKKKLKKLNSL